MTVMEYEQVAALTATSTTPSKVDQLKIQITQLTEQVAALTTKWKNETPKHCFCCNQLGHIQRNCPTRFASQQCYICNCQELLPIIDYVSVDVQIGKMKTPVCHNFIIVSSLIAPVILGIDFLQQHSFVLDFTEC